MHENGKSRSSVENFCLTVREKFLGTTSKFQNTWDLGKFHAYHGLPSIFFLSHSNEKLREEPSNVSKSFKCEVSKKILKKNGKSRFSVENFSAQSAESFRCGTLRYIRKVPLSKNFMPWRVISLFSVEFMSRLLPIKFVGEPLCVSESLGHRKLLSKGSRESPLIFLASQYWKISWVTPSTFQNFSGVETFYAWERKISFFSRKFLSHTSRKRSANHF